VTFLYKCRCGLLVSPIFGFGMCQSCGTATIYRETDQVRQQEEMGTLGAPQPANVVEQYDPPTVFLRQRIAALRRISAELRGFFGPEARADPEVQSILRDCDTLDQTAAAMATSANARVVK